MDRTNNKNHQPGMTTLNVSDKDKGKMEEVRGLRPLFVMSQVVGILCVILVAILTAHYGKGFAWRSDPSLEFNWHPLLMTIGFVYLYGNSIMVYRALRELRKYRLKLIHAGVHAVTIICVVIALVAVFDSHNLAIPPRANLYSLHSWIGLTTVILFCLQWAVSLLGFLYPGASMSIRAAMMPYHVFFGLAIFAMAVGSVISGLLEKGIFSPGYSDLHPQAVLINVSGMAVLVYALLVFYISTESRYKRHPRPEDGALLHNSPAE